MHPTTKLLNFFHNTKSANENDKRKDLAHEKEARMKMKSDEALLLLLERRQGRRRGMLRLLAIILGQKEKKRRIYDS